MYIVLNIFRILYYIIFNIVLEEGVRMTLISNQEAAAQWQISLKLIN